MTEQEAIAILFQQSSTPTGFLLRLQQGQGLDQQGVDQLWQVFDVLQQAWAERTCVPREALLALTYLDEALPAVFEQYPDEQDELIDLHFALIERITDLLIAGHMPEESDQEVDETNKILDESHSSFLWFWEEWAESTVIPERPMTETEALAVLSKQFGGSGLIVALRCRMGALHKLGMAKAWFLISQALETLQPIWAVNPCIPKDIAQGLAQIREGITNGWTFYEYYPTIQQDMLSFAEDLGAKVQRCLSADPQEKH